MHILQKYTKKNQFAKSLNQMVLDTFKNWSKNETYPHFIEGCSSFRGE